MSREPYAILPGALLIGDAHYSHRRPQLLSLLNAVENGELQTPQLILMGDIFDLLFGQIAATHAMNREAVALLRRLSETLPLLYLEGNHDYNLSRLFPAATVVPLSEQPLNCRIGGTTLLLAHGDFNQPLSYRLYTALIRNPVVLYLLGGLNRLGDNAIIRRLEAYLAKKDDCYVIQDFEAFSARHLAPLRMPPGTVFIEGHYHQGRRFVLDGVRYFNLPAFACDQSYAIVSYREKMFDLHYLAWGEAERNGTV